MDMKISGSGNIPSGEYENIAVSGSAKLYGNIKCKSFSTAGVSRGVSIDCSESLKTAGAASFTGNISAKTISSSGTLSCDGDTTAEGKISCAGSAKISGNVKCEQISVGGSMKLAKDLEAEKISVQGSIECDGLMNAEEIDIKAQGRVSLGSVGGSKINISVRKAKRFFASLSIFSGVVKNAVVKTSVEGDEIFLEYVNCPRVTGRIVTIGDGCKIDLVQYSETIEISPTAKIGRTENLKSNG